MQELINNIAYFINHDITPVVRVLIVGIFAILGLLAMKNAIKVLGDSKVKFFKKFFIILLCVVFIGLAVFVATA